MKEAKPAELLGLRIKALRKSRKLTQQQLGEECGINYKHLGAIERGQENPSLSILARIAEGLGVEIFELCRFHHEETDAAKLKRMIVNMINTIPTENGGKLQLIHKIVKAIE